MSVMNHREVIPARNCISDVSGRFWIQDMGARFEVFGAEDTILGLGSEIPFNAMIFDAHVFHFLVGGFHGESIAVVCI